MPFYLFIALATFTFGCATNGGPESDAASSDSKDVQENPWAGLDPIQLSSFRELRQTTLTPAVRPQSLVVDHRHGQALILDGEAETVWATDALYGHDARPACIDPVDVWASTSLQNREACPEGTEKVVRGHIQTPAPPAAIAVASEGGKMALLDEDGQLHWLISDVTQTSSFEFMRAAAGPRLGVDPTSASVVHLALSHNEIALAIDNVLHTFDWAGTPNAQQVHDAPILSLAHHQDSWWTTTELASHRDGQNAGLGGIALVQSLDSIWVLTPTALVPLDSSATPIAVHDPLGPAIFWGERLLYATSSGMVEAHPDGDITLIEENIVELQTNAAQELVVLDETNSLRIFIDETMYSNEHRLHVWGSTFIETPRKSQTAISCDGQGESIHAIHAMATRNLDLIRDLPAEFSLGVTPAHWRRAIQCGATKPLERLVAHMELGSLFHEAPTACEGDQDCYEAALQSDLDSFSETTHWVSGLGAHTDLSVDWIQALQQIGASNRYAFFGMSLRPDVVHELDIRAKDSWPATIGNHSQTWSVDSIADIIDGNESGWLQILPGNNIPMFNLGSCANLFLKECHPLGRGNGNAVDESDIESLNILLHRAMMSAQTDGTHTWNFHLPDIGEYDYTDGCAEDQRKWGGEDCEGATIQDWLFDVHLRLVGNGLMQWSTPSQLVHP